MPWLLYRSIMNELLRNILLTAGVLVTVIAFGAAIKPLASGLLAPADIARYVGLAMVPMLQFALPFAAGFGATLVLHRLTTDNEVQAAALSGISYAKFLLPVVALGLTISALMLGLVHYIIPSFWVQMEKLATKDVTRILQASVDRGEAFAFGEYQIFAEDMSFLTPPAGTAVKARIFLRKVAAAQLDRDRRIATDVTAQSAIADIYEIKGNDFLQIAMTDAVWFDSENNRLAGANRVQTRDPWLLPSSFRNETKFMSLPRLRDTRADPDSFHKVVEKRQTLASELQEREAWTGLEQAIARDGRLSLAGTERGYRYVILAERLRRGELFSGGGAPVLVEEIDDAGPRRRIEADRGELLLVTGPEFGLSFNLRLINCRITNLFDGQPQARPFEQSEHRIFDLAPAAAGDEPSLHELSSSALLARAREVEDDRVARAARELRGELVELEDEIAARIAQRSAISSTGILLVMLGALLAMVMRSAQPLTIYLLAFMPSIAATLVISGGEQMMRDGEVAGGLVVMWSGNATLFVVAAVAFFKLARN
jgi:lipopolysaccharide export LptBFGC system permease protein LptF